MTFTDAFDSFLDVLARGKCLAFASNRNAKAEGEPNVFVADWVE